MTTELLTYLLIALVGIVLSAVFSGMETGLYTINRVRLAVRADRGERRAVRLRTILDQPRRMLATLLVGNNMANYAGSFGIAAILDFFGVLPVSAILVNVCILVPLLFIFGETLPKDLFRTHTDRWSYVMSGFLMWCERLLTWTGFALIVQGFGTLAARMIGDSDEALISGTARQRISQLIKEGVAAGVLTESQTTLADRALAMRDLRVAGEMVPWRSVARIAVSATPQERRSVIERHPFSRLPVLDGRGRPMGVLSTLDALLEPQRPTRDLIAPTIEIEARTPVREVLRRMRKAGVAMAIVVSRKDGPPIGIVTFKDLVEPLTGELRAW